MYSSIRVYCYKYARIKNVEGKWPVIFVTATEEENKVQPFLFTHN